MQKEGKFLEVERRLRGRDEPLGLIEENMAKIWKIHMEKIINEENKYRVATKSRTNVN